MRLKKIVTLILIASLLYIHLPFSHAQELGVRNVRFEDRGETIVIRYELSGRAGKKYTVSVQLSDDGGRTFRIRLRSVFGDVGPNVSPGARKEIVWDLYDDFPAGLSGDDFVFAVDVVLQKDKSKMPYYLLGAGAVGGLAYFLLKGRGNGDPKGSIVISVPSDF